MIIPVKKYWVIAVLLITVLSIAAAGVVPGQTIENFKTDLQSFNDAGTRPVSSSLADYMDVQGAIFITDEKYDYAVLGHGFFKVRSHINGSIYYTRCGKFIRRDTAFFTESGDRILLSAENDYQLCNTDKKIVQISLWYPHEGQNLSVLDNKCWTAEGGCSIIKSEVVPHALEENPTDLQSLLFRLRNYITTCQRYDKKGVTDCMNIIDALLQFLKEKKEPDEINGFISHAIRQLIAAIDTL